MSNLGLSAMIVLPGFLAIPAPVLPVFFLAGTL